MGNGPVIFEVANFSGGVKTTRSHGFGKFGQQIYKLSTCHAAMCCGLVDHQFWRTRMEPMGPLQWCLVGHWPTWNNASWKRMPQTDIMSGSHLWPYMEFCVRHAQIWSAVRSEQP